MPLKIEQKHFFSINRHEEERSEERLNVPHFVHKSRRKSNFSGGKIRRRSFGARKWKNSFDKSARCCSISPITQQSTILLPLTLDVVQIKIICNKNLDNFEFHIKCCGLPNEQMLHILCWQLHRSSLHLAVQLIFMMWSQESNLNFTGVTASRRLMFRLPLRGGCRVWRKAFRSEANWVARRMMKKNAEVKHYLLLRNEAFHLNSLLAFEISIGMKSARGEICFIEQNKKCGCLLYASLKIALSLLHGSIKKRF